MLTRGLGQEAVRVVGFMERVPQLTANTGVGDFWAAYADGERIADKATIDAIHFDVNDMENRPLTNLDFKLYRQASWK
jgi:hypothetical protein